MLWLIASVGIATYLAQSQITGQMFARGATFCLARKIIGDYCLGGCSALVVCARRLRLGLRVGAGAGSRSSLPSRPSRSVLRVVPCGCPFPSPAGTPFHAVRAFGGPGPVALQVRAACPLGVGALVLPRRSPPPPPVSVWRTHYARFWCRAPLGRFQAVRAPPRFCAPVPCSAYFAPRGKARFLGPRAWLRVARPPAGGPALAS